MADLSQCKAHNYKVDQACEDMKDIGDENILKKNSQRAYLKLHPDKNDKSEECQQIANEKFIEYTKCYDARVEALKNTPLQGTSTETSPETPMGLGAPVKPSEGETGEEPPAQSSFDSSSKPFDGSTDNAMPGDSDEPKQDAASEPIDNSALVVQTISDDAAQGTTNESEEVSSEEASGDANPETADQEFNIIDIMPEKIADFKTAIEETEGVEESEELLAHKEKLGVLKIDFDASVLVYEEAIYKLEDVDEEMEEKIRKIETGITDIYNALTEFNNRYKRILQKEAFEKESFVIYTRVFPAPFVNSKGNKVGRIEHSYEGQVPYGPTDYVDHFLVNLYRNIENETGAQNGTDAFEYTEADPLTIYPVKGAGKSNTLKKRRKKNSKNRRKSKTERKKK